MMRRIAVRMNVLVAMMLVMLLLPAAVSAMDVSVRIYVDGELIESDHEAALVDDTPFVPAGFIEQHLNALTVWDSGSRTLAVERGAHKAQFVLNEKDAVISGTAVRLEDPPIVLSNEIYLPAEAVGEALGVKVTWDIVNYALQFYLPQDNPGQSSSGSESPSEPSDDFSIPRPDGVRNEDPAGMPDGDGTSPAVIGSIDIAGDQIVIQADGALDATLFTLTDPNRLVIDIPNSKISSMLNGQPTQLYGQVESTHPHVQRIRYGVFDDHSSTIRLVVDLHQPIQHSLIQQSDSNKLVVDIRSRSYQVVLDAGHGGKDPGAITYSGKYEKDFNLPLTLKVYNLLLSEPLISPVLTRSDDTFVELEERSAIANRIEADIFLSLHGNTYIPSIHGTETYYYDSMGKYWAETVHKHVVEATGFRDRNVRQQEYKVLRLAEMPAALIEIGYLSNKDQEALLYDDAFQDKVAQSIVNAIKEYLQILPETEELS